jgi:hypothetical protein
MKNISALLLAISAACFPALVRAATQPQFRLTSPQVLVVMGDSTIYGEAATSRCDAVSVQQPCMEGTAPGDFLARMMNAVVPTKYLDIAEPGSVVATLLTVEATQVPRNATVIIVYNGWNDKEHIVKRDYRFSDWKQQMDWALAAIRQRAPRARIIVSTMPNPFFQPAGVMPGGTWTYMLDQRSQFEETVAMMNEYFAGLGFPVADERCDPLMYNVKHFAPPEYSHLNDAGNAMLAERYFGIITGANAGRPHLSCPPYFARPTVKLER